MVAVMMKIKMNNKMNSTYNKKTANNSKRKRNNIKL